jgi:alpha-galactosidase/6-phospho-beta-glucosidase family protein
MFQFLENLKIVKFKNGNYAVRKGFIFHQYLNLYNTDKDQPDYWVKKSEVKHFTHMAQSSSLNATVNARDSYLKKKEYKKDKGKAMKEEEIFFNGLQKQEKEINQAYIANSINQAQACASQPISGPIKKW